MSPALAPTTSAIRRAGTSCQLRHTKACKRSGKWGNGTGLGALPRGRSAAVRPASFPAGTAPAQPSIKPYLASPQLPTAREADLRKVLRFRAPAVRVGFGVIADSRARLVEHPPPKRNTLHQARPARAKAGTVDLPTSSVAARRKVPAARGRYAEQPAVSGYCTTPPDTWLPPPPPAADATAPAVEAEALWPVHPHPLTPDSSRRRIR